MSKMKTGMLWFALVLFVAFLLSFMFDAPVIVTTLLFVGIAIDFTIIFWKVKE
jgi:hypothetical protein